MLYPTKEALLIELDNNSSITDESFSKCSSIVSELNSDPDTDKEWLIEKTEKFCQEKAIYNAIMESISIIDGKEKRDAGTIPELLSDALSVSFDPSIGMILLMIVIVVGIFITVLKNVFLLIWTILIKLPRWFT